MLTIPARLLTASDTAAAGTIVSSLLLPAARRWIRLPDVTRVEMTDRADLYLPPAGPSPGIVLVLGAVTEGRRYALLETAARTVAACGFATLVPELGRLRRLILGEDALDDLVEAALALPRHDAVTDAPVGLIGFSLGGSLAMLAAADPRLRGRVSCVASIGAYFRLTDMLTAATCGYAGPDGERMTLAAPSVFSVAATLAAGLAAEDREILQDAIDRDPEKPLEALSRLEAASLGPRGRQVLSLLANRDPSAVPELARELDGGGRLIERLSPESVVGAIQAPAWMFHDERDRHVPFSQFRALREAARGRDNFRFFATRMLEHTEPVPPMLNPLRLFGDYLPAVVKLFRFVHGPLGAIRRGGRLSARSGSATPPTLREA